MNPQLEDCKNCGCLERIKHLERENLVQWEKMKDNKEKVDKVLSKFNQILISLILLSLGLVANLMYMVLHVPKGG